MKQTVAQALAEGIARGYFGRRSRRKSQVGRFLRIFTFALLPALVPVLPHRGGLVAAAVAGAAEVAYRAVWPGGK